ncbi:hypothetical protein ACFW04_008713 [Cataglyphis niger]
MSGVSKKFDKENQRPMATMQPDDKNTADVQQEDVMSAGNKSADEAVNDALLEKLRTHAAKPQEAGDALRAIAAKIHARVTSSDRRIRERTLEKLWRKNSGTMESFIMTLENCKDHVVNCSITGVLRECISPRVFKSKSKEKASKNKNTTRISSRMAVIQLINLGITQVLLKLLITLQHADTITSEVLTQDILWILGQVAPRDQKFVSKIKLLNSVKVFHALLKQHYNNSRTLLSLLLIVKTLAKNSFSLQMLVKDGITSTLEKTFVSVGYTPHLKLKLLLECFKHLTINKLCCNKFVKIGMVHLLMRIFERWDKLDGQMRLKICNHALNTLQHLCVIKAGRKAIKSNNGLLLLYRFCTNCPEDKAYDCLLSRICGIINQCLEKKELPVPEMSPARFVLPEANVRANSAESGSDIDSQANSVASIGRLYSDLDSGDDEESHDSRNMVDNAIHMGDEVDESKFFAGVFTTSRSEEDLVGYHTFFKELGSLQSQLRIGPSNVKLADLCSAEDNRINSQLTKNGKASIKDFSKFNGATRVRSSDKHALKILRDVSRNVTDREAYCAVASKVRSIISFVKVAYPDLIGGDGLGKAEPLNTKDRKVCRVKLLTCVERGLHASTTIHEVVYDLDALANTASQRTTQNDERLLGNWDESRLTGKRNSMDARQLQFESRFESGNLRKAIQINQREYDLILTPDVNSGSRHQWFYFEVSGMEANVPYTFNIINCEKANSQFNFGMKPILFSVTEALCGKPGWVRTGVDICYYRNCYQRPAKGKAYLTTSFTVTFPHMYDVCYLAYHFPYTYSRLITNIWKWTRSVSTKNVYFRAETLCETLNGNENPVLTITSPDSQTNPIQMLPHLMQRTSPAFALPLCSFKVERNKESTARVAVWRQLGVSRSYTMESSFCGCDQGTLAGLHLDTEHLKAIGTDFCQALSMMKDGEANDWDVGKFSMEGHLLEKTGCIDDEECSNSESNESDFQT